MKILLYIFVVVISQTNPYITGTRIKYHPYDIKHRVPRNVDHDNVTRNKNNHPPVQWAPISQRGKMPLQEKFTANKYPTFRAKPRRNITPWDKNSQRVDMTRKSEGELKTNNGIYYDAVEDDGVQRIVNSVLDVVQKALNDFEEDEEESETEEDVSKKSSKGAGNSPTNSLNSFSNSVDSNFDPMSDSVRSDLKLANSSVRVTVTSRASGANGQSAGTTKPKAGKLKRKKKGSFSVVTDVVSKVLTEALRNSSILD